MFERRYQPLASRIRFLKRMVRNSLIGVAIIAGSLGVGTLGYHYLEKLPWIDAVLNASMILSGMGPTSPMQTTGGKLFATCYALFSGIAFLTTVALILAPALHRMLHHFHLAPKEDQPDSHY